MIRPLILMLAASGPLLADPAPMPVEPRTLPAPDQPVAPVEPAVKELDADRL